MTVSVDAGVSVTVKAMLVLVPSCSLAGLVHALFDRCLGPGGLSQLLDASSARSRSPDPHERLAEVILADVVGHALARMCHQVVEDG